MYCQNCGQTILGSARFCPNCSAPLQINEQQTAYFKKPLNQKSKTLHGCGVTLAVITALLVVFIISVTVVSNDDNSNNTTTEQSSTTEYITFEEYEKIETGMTYEEVVAIIGCEGKLVTSSDFNDGSSTATYSWSSKDLGGVTYGATVSFVDNKVEFKQQIGLDLADDVSNAINNLY